MLLFLAVSAWLAPWKWTHRDVADLRAWLSVVATLAAVVVALGLARRAERLARQRRPELSLTWSPIFGITVEDVTWVSARRGSVGDVATYLRLNVANAAGKDAAVDVELLIDRISEVPSEPDVWARLIDISYPALAWTHAGTTRLTLSPGVVRTIDLARAYGDPVNPELRDALELCIDPAPLDGRHRLVGDATYDLELTLSGRNADAKDYWMRIRYSPSEETAHKRISVVVQPTAGGSPLAYE